MKSFFNKILLFAVCLPLLAGAPARAASVNNIRLGEKTASTARIVVDLSHQVPHNVFTLKQPARLVVDLPETKFVISEKQLQNKEYLKTVRLNYTPKGEGRIVLEFFNDVTIKKAFVLAPQSGFDWRLVVDLEFAADAPAAPQFSEMKTPAAPPPAPAVQENDEDTRKKLIVLDPGHGGKDPGAIGVSGVQEKTLTLAMAKQLRDKLLRSGRYDVRMTRDTDVAVSLGSRRKFGHDVGADLFISIHADSIRKPETRGLSVYTLSETASDKEAEKLAERENKADIIAGLDLSGETQEVTDILIDLARRETNNLSSFFAEILVKELQKVVYLLPRTHRFAGFAVLKGPDVPSMLIEMGYLSNKEEERLLRQSAYRDKLAEATFFAIDRYFQEKHRANFN